MAAGRHSTAPEPRCAPVSKPRFECIPNFSEGRRPEVLARIRRAAEAAGVQILDFEADFDHNRSVLTLAGDAEPLLSAVQRTMTVAVDTIDLTRHQGTHPRIGAVDVVPFVPLDDTPMEEAVALAHRLGAWAGTQLGLPVFFYEAAALHADRRNLADVRRGQFEGLAVRLGKHPPDVGPGAPHPLAGAVAIGARRPLIAFNVYLTTDDLAIARAVARAVRASSGGLPGVKALAMDTRRSRGQVQVSMNLVDYPTTPLPIVLERVRAESRARGTDVASTELVGLMPAQAVEDVMQHYIALQDFRWHRVLEAALREGDWDERG